MTEIKDMLIETPIDKLIMLVKQRERLPLSEAAKILGTDEAQVEEWVRALEERDFVELIYPAIGEPVIILKKVTEKSVGKTETMLKKEKESIDKKSVALQKKLAETEKKMDKTNKDVAELESELREKLKKVEASMGLMNSMEKKKQEMISDARDIDKASSDAVKNIDTVKSMVEQIDKKIDEKISFIDSHAGRIGEIEKLRKEVKDDIENLDAEVKLTNMMFKGVKSPLLGPLRKIFERHEAKVDKIKQSHSKMHKKVADMKESVSNG
jgi:chromosome segregation ATPase